ncbi:MAG: quinone-dependent dihydroorotate dehydrogenase [Bdellovibrionota bacterium]
MKPWLLLPPQVAHQLAPLGLQLAAAFRDQPTYTWRPFTWRGLRFCNRLGTAGGVDKDGELIEEWWKFGPGFVEIGTVTPLAQGPNEGKIIDRDVKDGAVWNRLGFPGRGAWVAKENLRDLPILKPTPIFVNIGKNRETPNDLAVRDYAQCISILAGLADVFVVNISSPNTQGLRELLQPKNLHRFLGGVLAAKNKSSSPYTPILLKLSPDLDDDELRTIVEIACELGIDGFIATNTTLARDHGSPFPPEGGVSGRPLGARSMAVLKILLQTLGTAKGDKLVVSAGGVMTPDDVKARLDAGADLVQVYSTLIFEGPTFFERVCHAMLTD